MVAEVDDVAEVATFVKEFAEGLTVLGVEEFVEGGWRRAGGGR